jgi:hypothetical protein
VQPFYIDIDDHNGCAGLGQRMCGVAAYALRSTGDDSNFSL